MMREYNGLNQECFFTLLLDGKGKRMASICMMDRFAHQTLSKLFLHPPPSNLIYQNKQFVFSAIWLNLSSLCCYKRSLDSYACPVKVDQIGQISRKIMRNINQRAFLASIYKILKTGTIGENAQCVRTAVKNSYHKGLFL